MEPLSPAAAEADTETAHLVKAELPEWRTGTEFPKNADCKGDATLPRRKAPFAAPADFDATSSTGI